MNWQEINDSQKWNDFLINSQGGSFLQSFEFGSFYQKLGQKIWRLGLVDGEKLTAVCLLTKQKSKTGVFLYAPGGPVGCDLESWKSLIVAITDIAKAESSSFVRFDPRLVGSLEVNKSQDLGLVNATNYTQPKCTQILDLTQTEEQIRSGLSESTRYNVGWVERQGVQVKVSQNDSDIDLFEQLLEETSQRQKFTLHAQAGYYKQQFLALKQGNLAKLYLAYEPEKTGGGLLAASVVVNLGKTVTYLHSASSGRNPKLRAPYLMQWRIITDAKAMGATDYDFWGIAASDSPSDPWAGVTGFKKGFGGKRVCYQLPYDLPLSSRYNFDKIAERFRLALRNIR